MKLTWQDSEKMADDVVRMAEELGQGYTNMGKEPPDTARLLIQAQCAWTYMTLLGLLKQKDDADKARRRANIVSVSGRPLA